ncbi:hypothetical protein Efla_004966 [Eimeria flavescens]
MQPPLSDGSCLSSTATPDKAEASSATSSSSAACSQQSAASLRGHSSSAAPACDCVLLVHGSSSRRGGAHLNEDRLSVACWPVTAFADDTSSSSPSSSSSIGCGSRQTRQPVLTGGGRSFSQVISASAAPGCSSSSGNSSSSNGNSGSTDNRRWGFSLGKQQTQQQESALNGSSCPPRQPACPAAAVPFPQEPLPGEAALGDSAAAATAAATRVTDAGAAGGPRLCVRRPGLPPAYFVIDGAGPLQQRARQQRQQQPLLQRGAVDVRSGNDCYWLKSLEPRKAAQQTAPAATAAAATAAPTAAAAAGKAGEDALREEQNILSIDAALAVLVQGRQIALDRQRLQQRRTLCHAAAPCEGSGVSVSAAACVCKSPVAADEACGGQQDAAAGLQQQHHQREQQQQEQERPQEGCGCCRSFLLSVFDGHDSEVAAEFASQALPLLAAKFLPQRIAVGEERHVVAAAAVTFSALDNSFRKRCRVIQRTSGAACTSGCCALSAFVQGPHLFVFNLGDCRCAFLALGDLEAQGQSAAASQQQQQQQADCSGGSHLQRDPLFPHSSSSSSRHSHKPPFLSNTGRVGEVCRVSPSLRAALKRTGADEVTSAAASPERPHAAASTAALTFDQRPYTPLLAPPHTSPLPVSHEPLPLPVAVGTPDTQQQQQQRQQQQGKVAVAQDWPHSGCNSCSSTNCSTRSGSFAAQSSSCCCNPLSRCTCAQSLAAAACSSSSSSSSRERAAITFHWLSRDLRTSAPYELQRLRSLNASVEGGRLGGVLEPSRSVGDFDIKDSQPKGALSATPETAYLRLTGPGLLLLASDGFWDFVGPEEITKCLQQVQGVWRPLVNAARASSLQQQQQQQQQPQQQEHRAVPVDSAASSSSHRASAVSGSSHRLKQPRERADSDFGVAAHVPTAAALSRLSDRLLRRAKRLGSEDDTTCLVAFIKPLPHPQAS